MKYYVYFYDNISKDLFEVTEEMRDFEYELATKEEVLKQNWLVADDEGKTFVLAEGEFLLRNGQLLFKLRVPKEVALSFPNWDAKQRKKQWRAYLRGNGVDLLAELEREYDYETGDVIILQKPRLNPWLLK